MNNNRWLLATILASMVSFALGAVTFYVAASPRLDQLASVQAEAKSLRRENAMHAAKMEALEVLGRREDERLSPDALQLLTDTAASPKGVVVDFAYGASVRIDGHKENLTDKTPRSYARWHAAVDELLGRGYIEYSGSKTVGPYSSGIYRVTQSGYLILESNN